MNEQLGFTETELTQSMDKLLDPIDARERVEQLEGAGYVLQAAYHPTAAGLGVTGLGALNILRTRPRNGRGSEVPGPAVIRREDGSDILGVGIYAPERD